MGTLHIHDQIPDTPIVRRQLIDAISQGKFTVQELFHMAHYDKSAELYIDEAKRLQRPIDVVSIGAGDMWDLHVLVRGRYVKKAEILASYTAIDIIKPVSPFGKTLSDHVTFYSVQQDLNFDPTLPIEDEDIDVVVATEVLEHLAKDPALALMKEAYEVLRPGGVFYISTPNSDGNSRSDKYHIYEWPLKDLIKILTSIGFEIESYAGTYIDRIKFSKINEEHGRVPEEIVDAIQSRFSPQFQRVILATFYPEFANGVALLVRKPV